MLRADIDSDYQMSVRRDSLNIDASTYFWFTWRYRTRGHVDNITIRDAGDNIIYQDLTHRPQNTWYNLSWDFSGDADWTGTETSIKIWWDFNVSAGNHRIDIDYVYLYSVEGGGYLDNGGFRFSILDEYQNETGFFGFTYHNESYYNFSVNFFNQSFEEGYLEYFQLFRYTRDEWLRMEVKFHLDERDLDLDLTYDNNTEIFEGDLFDLFTVLPLAEPVIFTFAGLPRLCINNTQSALRKNTITLNFIDANWKILYWTAPDETLTDVPSGWAGLAQSPEDFNTISPYGCFVEDKKAAGWNSAYYQLDVTRFDGFTENIQMESRELDSNADRLSYTILVYNIQPNGSREIIAYMDFDVYRFGAVAQEEIDVAVLNEDTTVNQSLGGITSSGEGANYELDVSVSCYADYELNKFILQMSSDSPEYDRAELSIEWGNTVLTNEWLILHRFAWYDFNNGNNDEHYIKISGFDITRKDILGDIVGAILNPIVDVFILLLTPLILLLQFLAGVFKFVGDLIIAALSPLLELIGNVLNSVLDAILALAAQVWDLFDDILGDILTAVGDIASGIWSLFETVLEGIADVLDDVLTAIIGIAQDLIDLIISSALDLLDAIVSALLDLLSELVDFITGLIFFLWDALSLPNILAVAEIFLNFFIDFFTGLPQFIADLTSFLILYGLPGFLCLVWFYIAFMNAISCSSIGDWIDNLVDYLMRDITMGFSIMGFKIKFPLGLFLVPLTIFEFFAGTILFIW